MSVFASGRFSFRGWPALTALGALLLAGCSSPPRPEAGPTLAAAAPRTLLEGRGAFFNGEIAVVLTLGMDPPAVRPRGDGPGGGGGGPPSGGGGPGGGPGPGIGERRPGGGSSLGSPMRPVLLALNLENKGAAPRGIEVRDFDSELGNFAVRPDTFTLAPGESRAVDPMVSRLGVTEVEIPVTVTLRSGGTTETQVIRLKPVDGFR